MRFPHIRLGRSLVASLLALTPLWLRAAEAPATPPTRPPHVLTEKTDQGKDLAISSSHSKVDANSDILVGFLGFTNVTPAPPSKEWLQVSNVLHLVERTSAERSALQARYKKLDLADAAEVSRLRQDNQSFDLRAAALMGSWQEQLKLTTDDAFRRIRSGEFDGRTNSLLIYANLARWTRGELERLNRAAVALVSNRTVFVSIQAFHIPPAGQRRAVHVDNYDNIPAGDYQPIDRLGLRLTPAEQERLAMEVKMAEQARDALREIHHAAENGGAFASNLLSQVRAAVDSLEELVKQSPTAWELKFAEPAFLGTLNEIAKNGALTDRQRAAAASNAIWLAEFRSEMSAMQAAILKIQLLKNSLATPQAKNLNELLSRSGSVMQALDGVNSLLAALRPALTKWPGRLQSTVANFNDLQGPLNAEQLAALWPEEVKQFMSKLGDSFPKTLEMVSTARSFLFNDKGLGEAAALAEADLQAIWRDDLTPGLLELPRVGLVQDDTVELKIKYRERGPDGKPGASLPDETYKMKATLMGLHRKFGASLIYARGLRGDAEEQQWKPNVAATVHWFYRYRDVGDNVWKRGWNYVNPGFGIHLASLDQGEESVEFGTGANLSLFDNLINGGIGVNLNNDERPYVYFGLSLLEALNKAKGIGAGK